MGVSPDFKSQFSTIPEPVSAIIAAVQKDLQRQYTIGRSSLAPDDALFSSLRLSMGPQAYQGVDRFLKGEGSEEAAQHGQLIHDRLLMALEASDAQALAAATFPWEGSMPAVQITGPPPVEVGFAGPREQRRLTVGFRLILLAPHLIVLSFLGLGAIVLVVVGWFAALLLGRLPGWIASYLIGVLAYYLRVVAYLYLLNDRYPPYSLTPSLYPAELFVSSGPLDRLAVLFRIILVIPANIVSTLVGAGAQVVLFFAWLIVLVTRRMPLSLHQALAATLRYQTRVLAYFNLVTAAYPSGLFGEIPLPAPVPSMPTTTPWAGSVNEWNTQRSNPGAVEDRTTTPLVPPPNVGGEPLATRLVLTRAAKRLLVLFLVIGAASYIGSVVSSALTQTGNVSKNEVVTPLDDDYSQLSQAVNNFGTQVTACQQNGGLPCVQQAARTLAPSFSGFADQVEGLSVPGGNQQDATALSSDSRALAGLLNQMASASSIVEYQDAARAFQARAKVFDTHVQVLERDLTKA
jgi:hypothetical protein